MKDIIIDIKGLNKTYKTGKVAVKDVSFQIRKGDIFGFLGPNGAGKTTTITMLHKTLVILYILEVQILPEYIQIV